MTTESLAPPPLPSEALRFRFPPSLTWLFLGISLAISAFVVFVVAMSWIDPGRGSSIIALLVVVLCTPVVVVCFRSFLRFHDGVAVDESGIWNLPHRAGNMPTFIAWRDVAFVKAGDVSQRLILTDASGFRKINLEYQLQDFGKLRDFVIGHTALSTRQNKAPGNVFHRTIINKVILLGFVTAIAAVAWLCFDQGKNGSGVFFAAMACVGVWMVTRDPSRLEITNESVVIKYPFRDRTIALRDVNTIELTDISQRANVWAAVVIELKRGKSIYLFRFREGSLALKEALQEALSNAS